MALSYSRHMYAEVVFDQKLETWLYLHDKACAFFGGMPHTVVPDNLKAAVIRAAFKANEEPALNRSYRELARHFGCNASNRRNWVGYRSHHGKLESSMCPPLR